MKHTACVALILGFVMGYYPLTAQYTDTLTSKPPHLDTIMKIAVAGKFTADKKRSSFCPYIVPSSLIVYGLLSMHTDALQDVNESFKEEIYTDRIPHKTSLDNYLQYAPAAAVYALNAAGVHGENNFRDRTIIYGISNLIMGVTVFAVKNITKEPRPDDSNNLSFPSGHTSTAFAAAEFLRIEYKNRSPWYGIAGYAAAAATGYLRMQNNKHWAGDIVAGAGVGIISTKIAYSIYPAIKRKLFMHNHSYTVILPTYQSGAWGLGLAKQF